MDNQKNPAQQTQEEVARYTETFDTWQKKAYEIAKEHLGSSFHLTRSNGFNEWKKSQPNPSLHPK
jgi:hypothetical protein